MDPNLAHTGKQGANSMGACYKYSIVALIVSVLSIAFGIFSPWIQSTQPEITAISRQLSTISNQLFKIKTQLFSQSEKRETYLDDVLNGIDDFKNEIKLLSAALDTSDS